MNDIRALLNLIDLDDFRDRSGTIDLRGALNDHRHSEMLTPDGHSVAVAYLNLIEEMQPIRSRQAAAIAVATAIHLGMAVD